MCVDPLSAGLGLASFGIGAAGAISKYGAAASDAAAQAQYQAQERYNALYALGQNYNQIGARQVQERDSASQALFDNEIRAAQAVAKSQASAAEGGVEGNSVESVARDFYRQQGRIDNATIQNEGMAVQQLQEEKKQAQAQYLSRTNMPAIKQPSLLNLGLEIGGAGLQAFDLYDRRNNPKK